VSWLSLGAIDAAERVLGSLEGDLRMGRHDRLEKLARDLSAALDRLGHLRGVTNRPRLSALRDRAARLGRLVQAAQAGLRDARGVLDAPHGFASYDASGRAGQIAPARAQVERRR